jgi:dsRNA-specific ribonuclease
MATLDDAKFIQQRLGYSFQNEEFLLLALTAAGKGGTEDGIEKQGNSRLAHFGNYLMQFILAWVGFTGHQSRGER